MKVVRAQALQLLAAQLDLGDKEGSTAGRTDAYDLPHPSHQIWSLHVDYSTIFCNQCGSWSARTLLKGLALLCQRIKDGTKSQLRLLQCGIRPASGARLPF